MIASADTCHVDLASSGTAIDRALIATPANAVGDVLEKSGRYPASARIAEAHHRVAVGDDAVFEAALRRAGALRVRSIGDLFSAARALVSRQRPRGNRLAVVTNGGGPAVIAADAAAESGIHLAQLADDAARQVGRLPLSWSANNPIDILFDAGPERFRLAIERCLADEGVHATLVIVSPGAFFDPPLVARMIAEIAHGSAKPVLDCVVGESSARAARRILVAAGVPTFRTPESAVTALSFMEQFARQLSDQSHYSRFFSSARELTPRQLSLRSQIQSDKGQENQRHFRNCSRP